MSFPPSNHKTAHLLFRLLVVSGVVTGLARSDDPPQEKREPAASTPKEEATRTATLTPEEQEEVNDFLKRAREFLDESRAERRRHEQLLRIVTAATAGTAKLLPPPIATPPNPPTIDFALPRGVSWLASQQGGDGRWGSDVVSTVMAQAVFATDPFLKGDAAIARWRVVVGLLPEQPVDATPDDPHTKAVDLYFQAMITEVYPCREAAADLRRKCSDLLATRRHDGTWSAVAHDEPDHMTTAWAIMALRAASDAAETLRYMYPVDIPRLEWSGKPEFPETSCGHIVASLLRHEASTTDSSARHVRRLAQKLIVEMGRAKERSLEEWYVGAIALKADGAEEWKVWRQAMSTSVLRSQRTDGSWAERNDEASSRVRATALAILCLRAAEDP